MEKLDLQGCGRMRKDVEGVGGALGVFIRTCVRTREKIGDFSFLIRKPLDFNVHD